MSQHETESTLLHHAQKGDRNAFDLLYKMHLNRVRAIVAHYTQDPDDRDDLQQTVFFKVFLGLKRFRGDAAFTTWLTRIALNVCTTYLRALRTRRNSQTALQDQITEQSRPITPEEMALQNETRHLITRSIRALPSVQQQAVWLRYMKDLSYHEIVQELNVPLGTVKIWLYRGKHQLKHELKKRMPM